MSPDELIVLLVVMGVSLWGWGKWYGCLASVWPPDRSTRNNRLILALLPPTSLLAIYIVISTIAAFDVVGDAVYVFFYAVLGLAWLVVARWLMFALLDISWRDDVIERNNLAAAYAMCGGLLGLTAIYAGGNVGDGPGWWVVVFTGLIASALWFGSMYILHRFSGLIEKITIDRNLGAGIRAFCYMLGTGLLLGRASAGDWVTAERTFVEFWYAWPLIPLLLLALWIERSDRDKPLYDTQNNRAWVLGVTYIVLALAAFLFFPPLTQNPWYSFLGLWV